MVVGREEAGVFAAEIERLFQMRDHRREVVRRPRPRPGIVGGGAVRVGARDIVRRDLDRLLEVAPYDADQAGVVVVRRQALGIGFEIIDQPAERRIDEPFMRQPAKRRGLTAARGSATGGHVSGLVPRQHRAGGIEIVNLQQQALELRELHFGRSSGVVRPRLSRLGPALADLARLDPGFPGFGGFAHAWLLHRPDRSCTICTAGSIQPLTNFRTYLAPVGTADDKKPKRKSAQE